MQNIIVPILTIQMPPVHFMCYTAYSCLSVNYPKENNFELNMIWYFIDIKITLYDCTNVSLSVTQWSGLVHFGLDLLTHWGRVTHICISKLTIIGSDNGLLPGRRQAIIWTNVGILLNGTLGIYFSEILSEIHTFSFKKMHLKMSSAKRHPFCLGLNVLMECLPPNCH